MAYLTRSFIFMGFDFIADIEYRVTHWGCEAKTYGPPENCYPAEGPEWEIESISICIDDPNLPHYPFHEVTGAWLNQLAEFFSDDVAQHIAENPADDSYTNDDGWFDSTSLD